MRYPEPTYDPCPGVRSTLERLFAEMVRVTGPVRMREVRLKLTHDSAWLELVIVCERCDGPPDFHYRFAADIATSAMRDSIRIANRLNRNQGALLNIGSLWARACEDHTITAAARQHHDAMTHAERLGAPPAALAELRETWLRSEQAVRDHFRVGYDHMQDRVTVGFDPAGGDSMTVSTLTVAPPQRSTLERMQEVAAFMDANPQIMDSYFEDLFRVTSIPEEWRPTAEEMARRRERTAKRQAEQEAAQAKGLALLEKHLTPMQLQEWKAFKYFHCKGNETGRTYRILNGRQQNVYLLKDNGDVEVGLCFLPYLKDGTQLVAGDCMLAQKLTLELSELEALQVAIPFGPGRAAWEMNRARGAGFWQSVGRSLAERLDGVRAVNGEAVNLILMDEVQYRDENWLRPGGVRWINWR